MIEPNNQYISSYKRALIAVTIFSFWVMYVIISYYNRFAADDYSYISLANHEGIIGGAIKVYLGWDGGIIGTLFQATTLSLLQNATTLLGYNLFLLLLVSFSLFLLANELALYFKLPLPRLTIFFITQLFIQALFFSGFSISENWFWVIGGCTYIYPLCIISISISCFIIYKQKSSVQFFLLSLLFIFFFGFSRINYIFTFCLICFGVILGQFYFNRKVSLSSILYVFFFTAGTSLNILAPGNYKRMVTQQVARSGVQHYPLVYQMSYIPLHFIQIVVLHKSVFLLAFIVPIAYLIYETLKKNKTTLKLNVLVKLSGVFLLIFVFSLLSNTAILYKAYGWGMGNRTVLHISTFLILFLISVFLIISKKIEDKVSYIFYLPLCIGIYFNVKTLINQYPIVSRYAHAHDARTALILEAKQNFKGNILFLDSLPPSGVLFGGEMSKDTANYINADMKSRFDIPFAIALR